MKILVTGGLGSIGYVLVNFLKKYYDVYFCDLPHFNEKNYFRCDISSFNQLNNLFEKNKFDYVFHLGGEFGRWNGEDFYENMWKTNVIGTKNLIRIQEKYKFRMIFASSSEVYGDYNGIMTEDVMEKNFIKQKNDYALSKWVSEIQIMNSKEMFNTETVRVRIFNTYGPGEHFSYYRSVACRFIYKALMKEPYTVYLGHTRTSTYITDLVETFTNIPKNFKSGEVYNIAGDDYHTIKEMSDEIIKLTDGDEKLIKYEDEEKFTTLHKKVSCEKAIKDLNHQPKVKLKDGLKKTVNWMKSVYIEKNNKNNIISFL
tara:strand:+ start:83 stop:1024 length:942 start_codon:yes stop_codon:yes gene_type:complete